MRMFTVILLVSIFTACANIPPVVHVSGKKVHAKPETHTNAVSECECKSQTSPTTTAFKQIEPGVYPVQVTCDLDEAIKAGVYGYVSEVYTSAKYPKPECKAGKRELSLFEFPDFNSDIVNFSLELTMPSEVLAKLENYGWRPATMWELLALGRTYPILQGEFFILGMGTSWNMETVPAGIAHVTAYPSLGWYYDEQKKDQGRALSFAHFTHNNNHGWRPANVPMTFAVVRK